MRNEGNCSAAPKLRFLAFCSIRARDSIACLRRPPHSPVSRRRMVLATTAGKAKLRIPEHSGMRTSKLRQSVFSVTGMILAAWVCIWRRSKLKLRPTGCQAWVSSRQITSTTDPIMDSSMSVSSRKGPVSPSPPSRRSMIDGASTKSSCSTDNAPRGSRRTEET